MKEKKVVITGLGVICAIGDNITDFAEGLQKGKNGITKITSINTEKCQTELGGEIKTSDFLDLRQGRTWAFLEKAVAEAVDDSRFDPGAETGIGLVIGSSLGNFEHVKEGFYCRWKKKGINTFEDAVIWQKGSLSYISMQIAEKYGLNGPLVMISTACSAGTNSLGYAYELVKKGYCDMVISGGADAIYDISLTGFSSLMSMARGYPKPFDENREGLSLGEGAGVLIIESEENALRRKAKIYVEITGYSLGNDAYHVTSPDPEGEGAYRAMKQCLENSGLEPDAVQYVNTHGTGTKANDSMELKAIQRLFKNNKKELYITSIKSMIGHCLGAAGSIEAIATVLSIKNSFIPPTINTTTPIRLQDRNGDESPVKIVLGEKVTTPVDVALSNSFAFAGNIATIGFRKYGLS